MTTSDWILVGAAIVGGILVGIILSRVLNAVFGSPARPEPLQQAAGPLSSLGLWAGVVGGLLIALGIISPSSVDQLPKDLINFLPKVLAAAILVIATNVLASFALAAVAPAMARASTSLQNQVSMIVRGVIVGLGALLAIRQLGVDTAVINLGVAAIFFGIAASLTMLVGLGGHRVATEVASTRAVKRLVQAGDQISVDGVTGLVTAIHPTAVEVTPKNSDSVLIPSSILMSHSVSIRRGEPLLTADDG